MKKRFPIRDIFNVLLHPRDILQTLNDQADLIDTTTTYSEYLEDKLGIPSAADREISASEGVVVLGKKAIIRECVFSDQLLIIHPAAEAMVIDCYFKNSKLSTETL